MKILLPYLLAIQNLDLTHRVTGSLVNFIIY